MRGSTYRRRATVGGGFIALLLGTIAVVFGAADPAQAFSGCYSLNLPDNEIVVPSYTGFGASLRETPLTGHPVTGDQLWCVTGTEVGQLRNNASQLCINTDGKAGHNLTTEVCDTRAGEVWDIHQAGSDSVGRVFYHITNVSSTPLNFDLSGGVYNSGANIIGWPPSTGWNQVIYMVGA
jgi:hypothetical protein